MNTIGKLIGASEYPLKIRNELDKVVYIEYSNDQWEYIEYDDNGKITSKEYKDGDYITIIDYNRLKGTVKLSNMDGTVVGVSRLPDDLIPALGHIRFVVQH
jgi:hypothetical protein